MGDSSQKHEDHPAYTACLSASILALQCKPCATAEERRRRGARPTVSPEHAKQVKRCTRCNLDKSVEQFCQNSRSFDGRYSQCRTCVADKVCYLAHLVARNGRGSYSAARCDSCTAIHIFQVPHPALHELHQFGSSDAMSFRWLSLPHLVLDGAVWLHRTRTGGRCWLTGGTPQWR